MVLIEVDNRLQGTPLTPHRPPPAPLGNLLFVTKPRTSITPLLGARIKRNRGIAGRVTDRVSSLEVYKYLEILSSGTLPQHTGSHNVHPAYSVSLQDLQVTVCRHSLSRPLRFRTHSPPSIVHRVFSSK